MANIKRILAWAALICIAAAFISLIYLTATGAPANQIMAVLFVLLVVPVMVYAFLMIVNLTKHDDKNDGGEETGEK